MAAVVAAQGVALAAHPKKPPPPPRAPAPKVVLALDAPTPRGPWTLRVTNEGDIPVRLAADARLASLDVTPRGEHRAIRCELPLEMRPGDDLDSALVLPPKRSYAETFEPRLYCFGATRLQALVSGSIVVAHLGWTGTASAPPYAVAGIDGVEPEVSPLKAIDGQPISLPDEPTPPHDPAPAADDPAVVDAPHLVLAGAPGVDAYSADAIEVPLTLRNESSRAVIVRFRPETLAFDVIGPDSLQTCTWPSIPSAAIREAFTRIPAKGSATLSVLLSAYCGGHTLDHAGLYVVRPRLDTRRASGAAVGYRTFDGVVLAGTPTVVRLRRGVVQPPLRRPRLEPQPQ
jgi:hypothetical protein